MSMEILRWVEKFLSMISIETFHVPFFNYYGHNISDLINQCNMAEPDGEFSLVQAVHLKNVKS